MENITLIGMKELNQRLMKIERSLKDISESLGLLAKIMNRQNPAVRTERPTDIEEDEDE